MENFSILQSKMYCFVNDKTHNIGKEHFRLFLGTMKFAFHRRDLIKLHWKRRCWKQLQAIACLVHCLPCTYHPLQQQSRSWPSSPERCTSQLVSRVTDRQKDRPSYDFFFLNLRVLFWKNRLHYINTNSLNWWAISFFLRTMVQLGFLSYLFLCFRFWLPV